MEGPRPRVYPFTTLATKLADALLAAPDGRCFPVARSVTLSTLFNLADRNRICLNGKTPNDVLLMRTSDAEAEDIGMMIVAK